MVEQQSFEASSWASVTYGNGIYAATAWNGTNRVMTSDDAITWVSRPTAAIAGAEWLAVTFGSGQFVAVSINAGVNRVMTSTDGITWTGTPAASAQRWMGVAYGAGTFVAVANGSTLDTVMTSTGIADLILDQSEWTVVP
jgi:hypothetical protein